MKTLLQQYRVKGYLVSYIDYIISDIEKNNQKELIESIEGMLKNLIEYIGILSHNIITQSAERIKLFTNLYTVIFIYLKQLNVVTNGINLGDVAETLLTSDGMAGRLLNSIMNIVVAPLYPNANIKGHTQNAVALNNKTIGTFAGGKSKRNKKNNKKSKTKRRRSQK